MIRLKIALACLVLVAFVPAASADVVSACTAPGSGSNPVSQAISQTTTCASNALACALPPSAACVPAAPAVPTVHTCPTDNTKNVTDAGCITPPTLPTVNTCPTDPTLNVTDEGCLPAAPTPPAECTGAGLFTPACSDAVCDQVTGGSTGCPSAPTAPGPCDDGVSPTLTAPCIPAPPTAPGPCDDGVSPTLTAPCVPPAPSAPAECSGAGLFSQACADAVCDQITGGSTGCPSAPSAPSAPACPTDPSMNVTDAGCVTPPSAPATPACPTDPSLNVTDADCDLTALVPSCPDGAAFNATDPATYGCAPTPPTPPTAPGPCADGVSPTPAEPCVPTVPATPADCVSAAGTDVAAIAECVATAVNSVVYGPAMAGVTSAIGDLTAGTSDPMAAAENAIDDGYSGVANTVHDMADQPLLGSTSPNQMVDGGYAVVQAVEQAIIDQLGA